MVRAILDGTKTQTRRVLKPRPLGVPVNLATHGVSPELYSGAFDDPTSWGWPGAEERADAPISLWPEWWGYCPGDTLWVRETCWAEELPDGLDGVRYEADKAWRAIDATKEAAEAWVDLHHYAGRRGALVPSIHMPRWASRITLRVTAVRVERLHDISEEDARAEGVEPEPVRVFETPHTPPAREARPAFASLWESIHGPRAWDANPWVAAVSFEWIT